MDIEAEAFELPAEAGEGTSKGNFEEGMAMKQQDKTKLGRRDFLRAMGAGAGVAVTAAAPLATEAVAANPTRRRRRPATRKPIT